MFTNYFRGIINRTGTSSQEELAGSAIRGKMPRKIALLVATASLLGSVLSLGLAGTANAAETDPTAPSSTSSNNSLRELQALATKNRAAEPASTFAYPHCNGATRHALKGSPSENGGIPSYATTNYNCILESGNVNADDEWLQYSLRACYQKNIAIDGSFGPATYNALLQVQSQLGVTIDGVYGPGTRNAILFDSSLYCHRLTDFVGF